MERVNNIEVKKDKATILLRKEFYVKEAIEESLKDFKEICSSNLTEKGNYFTLLLKPKTEIKSSELAYEFCNYVLALMKNKTLV